MSAPAVLESKIRLIIGEMERTVDTTTKAEVNARAAKQQLRTGATILRVFQIGLDAVKTAADKMLEARLSTTNASDAEISAAVRAQLEPYLRARLEKERAKEYATSPDQWDKCVVELWPDAATYFNRLEDRVRSLRHEKDSKETHLDRLFRRAKDHPGLAWVLFIVLAITSAIGAVEVVAKAVQTVRGRLEPAAPSVAATAPALAPVVPVASRPQKYRVGDCVLSETDTSPEKIVKIVGVGDDNYRVFTHLISQGHLVLAEDYGTRPRAMLDAGHSKVECPIVESTFSPDKYIKSIGPH